MTCISTVFALVSGCVEEELVAECAEDDLVELLLNEFVTVHLVDLLFALTKSALAAKTTSIHWALPDILLD